MCKTELKRELENRQDKGKDEINRHSIDWTEPLLREAKDEVRSAVRLGNLESRNQREDTVHLTTLDLDVPIRQGILETIDVC